MAELDKFDEIDLLSSLPLEIGCLVLSLGTWRDLWAARLTCRRWCAMVIGMRVRPVPVYQIISEVVATGQSCEFLLTMEYKLLDWELVWIGCEALRYERPDQLRLMKSIIDPTKLRDSGLESLIGVAVEFGRLWMLNVEFAGETLPGALIAQAAVIHGNIELFESLGQRTQESIPMSCHIGSLAMVKYVVDNRIYPTRGVMFNVLRGPWHDWKIEALDYLMSRNGGDTPPYFLQAMLESGDARTFDWFVERFGSDISDGGQYRLFAGLIQGNSHIRYCGSLEVFRWLRDHGHIGPPFQHRDDPVWLIMALARLGDLNLFSDYFERFRNRCEITRRELICIGNNAAGGGSFEIIDYLNQLGVLESSSFEFAVHSGRFAMVKLLHERGLSKKVGVPPRFVALETVPRPEAAHERAAVMRYLQQHDLLN
jgi:hypothetical protein